MNRLYCWISRLVLPTLAGMMLIAALACGLPTTTIVVTATSAPSDEEGGAEPLPPPTEPPAPTMVPEEPEEADDWEPPAENPLLVPGFSARYECISEVWYDEPLLRPGVVHETCDERFSLPITYWVMDDGTLVKQREGESLPDELPMFHGDRVAMLGILGADTALLWVPDVTRTYIETGYSVDLTSYASTIEDQEFAPAGSETITVAGQTIDAIVFQATYNKTEEDSASEDMAQTMTWQVTITEWFDPASGLVLRVEWRRKLVACEAPNPSWQSVTCLPMTQNRDLVLVYELVETTVPLGGG